MYPISDELKKLFLDGNKKCVKLTLNGVSFVNDVITEADVLSDSLTVDRYCSSGNKIEVGSAIAAELTLTLVNNNEKFGDKIFEGADVALEIGIEGVTDSFIPCGKFTVDEPPRSSFHIKLKALDYMMRFDKRVDLTKLSFPMSVKALLDRICEICEVEISSDINLASLPNMDQTVMNAPASGDLTYRQILQWIAQITGTCAFMDWNGKLCLSWFTDTGMTLTPSLRYIGGNIDENDITISGVTVGTETKGSADYALLIEGNQLIYPGTEEVLAENIYNAIKGLTYRPFACNCIPMPFLYPLDIVSYEELNGNIIQTVITNHNFGLNKASALSAIGETATKNNYSSRRGITKQEIDAAISEALKGVDSKAEHIYIKYSPYDGGYDEDGNLVWSGTPTADTVYLGTCATNNATVPDAPSSYKWVKIRGADGINGKDGKDGQDGENGKDGQDGNDGRGVSKVETEYRLSTSDTSLSSGYTWGTDAPTWQDGLYLWTRFVTYYTDGTNTPSDPVVDASWKKTSVVDEASKELNETLANALGLHVTEYTVGNSKIRYYHSSPSLTDSKSGDTILVFNSNGFGVCKTGWNDGSPSFTYGATFDGKAVWDILTANKISADLIETGSIKSLSTAKVQTTINLDDGTYTSTSGNTKVTIQGGEVDEESGAETTPAGILLDNLSDGSTIQFSVYGMAFLSSEYQKALSAYAVALVLDIALGTNNAPALKPADPYFSSIAEKDIKTTNIHCKNIYIAGTDGNEYNLLDELTLMAEETNSLRESLSALQEKYTKLLESIGQTCDHSSTITKKENVVSPTCTEPGSYDNVVYCATCNAVLSRSTVTVDPTGHTDSTGDGYCDDCGAAMGSSGELTITEEVETLVNIPTQNTYVYLKFVPQYSGSYTFESLDQESLDPDGQICDSNKVKIGDCYDGSSGGFCVTCDEFEAGTTYYLAARLFSGTGTLKVKVSYNAETTTPTYAENTIVDGVLYIGTNTTSIDNTYQGNTEITKVIIPNNVTEFATDGSDIGGQCFRGCTNLTEVVVGSGITKITYACFYDCSSLAKVTIPTSVTTISEFAFGGTALTDVYYKGTQEQWTSINIESNNTPLTNATIHYNS